MTSLLIQQKETCQGGHLFKGLAKIPSIAQPKLIFEVMQVLDIVRHHLPCKRVSRRRGIICCFELLLFGFEWLKQMRSTLI